MIKILLISENVLFAEALLKAFELNGSVEFHHVHPKKSRLLKNFKSIEPNVAIFDVYTLSEPKIKLLKEFYRITETVPCGLIISEGDFQLFNVKSFVDFGFKGIIIRESGFAEFMEGIRQLHLGKYFFSNEIIEVLLSGNKPAEKQNTPAGKKDKDMRLNVREIEVLQSICEGKTNKETSESLYLSPRTIQWHRANLMHKVGAKNTSHLIMYAIKNGYYHSLD